MSNPVSLLTLESIPWMSAKSLSHAMREVSLRGPNDLGTWTRLVGRADMIAHSFNPKQTALVVHSLGKIFEQKLFPTDFIETFLGRFTRKFLPHIVPHTSPLDAAQIAHGLAIFGKTNKRVSAHCLSMMMDRVSELAFDMDMKAVSMCAASLSDKRSVLPEEVRSKCIVALSSRFLQLDDVNEQSFAQILRACTTMASEKEVGEIVTDLCVKNLKLFQSMSVRSLSVCLNSLAKVLNTNTPVVNEILLICSERIEEGDSGIATGASLLQLGVLLRSLQKLGIRKVSAMTDQAMVKYIQSRDRSNMSTHTVCVLLSALVEVPGTTGLVRTVIDSVRIMNGRFSPTEIAAISNALKRSEVDPEFVSEAIRDMTEQAA